jgi:pantoate--beta-alanine ligase
MGYLHEGHLSLIKESKQKCDITIVSIFVNPTQFAPSEDFNSYPRDLTKDKKLLEDAKVDYLFLPEVNEIYPQNFQTNVNVEQITQKLEGEFRPTHFRGVTTVVMILFNSVQPDFAFFGQKDAQQAAVIKQMVKDLKLDVKVVVCSIVRESDGLALSSRNVYLSPAERKDSLVLYRSLELAKKIISSGERRVNIVISGMNELISGIPATKIDYIKIVESDSFEIIDELSDGKEYYVLIACKIGKTRLIDNIRIAI